MQATWNGQIVAESNDTIVVEGNHYFPADSVNMSYMQKSETHSTCPWKGEASYYTIEVGGERNIDAAWYYPKPMETAASIEGRVAFWKGVEVKD
jgi:uncharacterized protein (DUF427 family)